MRDTIDMAREAGWKDLRNYDSQMQHDFFMGNTDSLNALVELARADEREACAKVCEDFAVDAYNNHDILYEQCADAIRARGQS